VKVAVEALQKGDFQNDTVKTQDYLRMAALEIERLELLISKVLNDSLLENGNMMLDLERTELTKLVNETIHLLHIRFSEANASVHFEKGNEELFTNIDRLHIQGVLVNILDNSLKYADSAPKIEIRSGLLNGKIFISVKDNGPGIPEEYKNKIFEKFFRVPAHDKHNVKGYGLGLSYATLIMKQHRGEISVVNNTDAGCTFTLFFPSA
jgi:K+-sensing histidine kinase KdpD